MLPLLVLLKLAKNVLLTGALSYLLRADVSFQLWGRYKSDLLKHMLPVLYCSNMTMSMRSSLMAAKVKGF